MNWTCDQIELRLSERLDGLMSAEDERSFDAHAKGCARCAPLVANVAGLLRGLQELEPLEAPPRLVYRILDGTLGPREGDKGWGMVLGWLRGLASPKFAYGSLSVVATCAVLLTTSGFSWRNPRLADLSPVNLYRNADRQAHLVFARGTKFVSDLRVVYEIQSRLRQENEIPTSPEHDSLPESSPNQQPGSTDGTRPDSPRQQNRANGIAAEHEMLAMELPLLGGRSMR